MRLVDQRELCVDGGSWEGRQAEEVFLQQGHVGLLVHSRHVLSEGDEEEDPTDFLQLTGKHLEGGAEMERGAEGEGSNHVFTKSFLHSVDLRPTHFRPVSG